MRCGRVRACIIFCSTLALAVVPVIVGARSREAVLLPAKPGKPSQIVYPEESLQGIEYLIQYDGGESNYYLRGLTSNDTLGVFFTSPAACTLLEIHYCRYAYDAPDDTTYYAFVADVPEDFTWEDIDEYHSTQSMPGPSPIGSLYADAEFSLCYTGEWQWDTLRVSSQPDIGLESFFAGYAIRDTAHSCRIDAGTSPPYHALAWKQAGSAPAANGPGWYSSWHLYWIRALVKVYSEVNYDILIDRLGDSYLTTERIVTAHVWDLVGIPPDSQGIAWVKLHYTVNSEPEDTLYMVLISGDSLDGIYSAAIPGVSPYDTVRYYAAAEDYNGHGRDSRRCSYVIREGTPGNILILIENDEYYGTPYTPDPVGNVTQNVDVWDEYLYGPADSSVLNFYHPSGKGSGLIFWFTFSGVHFGDETDFLADFLDAGGKLFVSSQDLPGLGFALGYGTWYVGPGHFLYDYMKVSMGLDDYLTDSSFTQHGVPGDPISGAVHLSDIVVYATWYSNWAGRFDVYADTCVTIFYDALGEAMGYRYQDASGYQIVFIYWPIQSIHTQDLSAFDTLAQDTLIARTLDWFGYEIGVEEEESPQRVPLIAGSRPNPFRESASIEYQLLQRGTVRVAVYNLSGQEVRTLVDGVKSAGVHSIVWDATDSSGRRVPSGTYYLRVRSDGYDTTKKLVVVR